MKPAVDPNEKITEGNPCFGEKVKSFLTSKYNIIYIYLHQYITDFSLTQHFKNSFCIKLDKEDQSIT